MLSRLAALKVLLVLCFTATTGQAERHEFSRPLMGMAFRIVVYADDAGLAKRAARAAFDRVAVLKSSIDVLVAQTNVARLQENAWLSDRSHACGCDVERGMIPVSWYSWKTSLPASRTVTVSMPQSDIHPSR